MYEKQMESEVALGFIREIRLLDPGMGGRKIWEMYRRQFVTAHLGRDVFEALIDRNGLKLRNKLRKPRTTDSSHGLRTYPNLIKDRIPTHPNEIWVSDITYIMMVGGGSTYRFCYLSLILDSYTEEIVGWDISESLEKRSALRALKMALDSPGDKTGLIHHSDRGCQYASNEYTRILISEGIQISMTESGNPKDNPQAERINNTMKNELLYGKVFHSAEQVRQAVSVAVQFYNTRRPHMSLDMRTPCEMLNREGERNMKWTSRRETAIRNKTCVIPEKGLPLPGKEITAVENRPRF